MRMLLKAITGSCAVASLMLVQSDAQAGVSNPDYYFVDITDFVFATPGGRVGVYGPSAVQFEGDIDNTGAFTYGGSTFAIGFTPMTGYTAQFTVVSSGTSGMFDPAHTAHGRLTMNMRIKFLGGLPATCQTSLFTVSVTDNKPSSFGSMPLGPFTGNFQFVAADFVIPPVTAAGCGAGAAATINSTLGLGTAAGNIEMFVSGSITNPQILQP